MKRVLLITGAVGIAFSLTACGDTSDTSTTASPTASASASPSGGMMVGQDPATWTPVMVTADMNGSAVVMTEGQFGVIEGLPEGARIQVVSDNPSVVEAVQPTDNGDWQGNAGFSALIPGTTMIEVVDLDVPAEAGGASNVILQFTVAVEPNNSGMTDSTIVGNDPATWAPLMIDPTMTDVSVVTGQHVVFPDYEYSSGMNYTIESSDENVARVELAADSMVPSFVAVGPGEATVTVRSGFIDKDGVKEVQSVKVYVDGASDMATSDMMSAE